MQCEASQIFTKYDLIYRTEYINFFQEIKNKINHILNEDLRDNLIAGVIYNSRHSVSEKINKINSLLTNFCFDSELRILQEKDAETLAKFIQFLSKLNVKIHYNDEVAFDAMEVSSLYIPEVNPYLNTCYYYLSIQDRFCRQTSLYVECDEAYTEEVNFLGFLTERQWKCYHDQYFLFCDLSFSVHELTTDGLRKQVYKSMKNHVNALEAYKQFWFFPEWTELDESVFNEIKAKQLLKSLT